MGALAAGPQSLERAVKAVVLLSGGLDSTTALAVAQHDGFGCHALSVIYAQRHHCEVDAATRVARRANVPLQIVEAQAFGGIARSALTSDVEVPKDRSPDEMSSGIPTTYVPARNTVLLGLALAYAETIGARTIYTGFNVLDASGYPDCRPAFVQAFEDLAQVATAPGERWSIRVPLIALTKAQIIRLGFKLGVEYGDTHSCYDPVFRTPPQANTRLAQVLHAVSGKTETLACGRCDSCQLRRKGFIEADIPDPTRYA